MQYILNKYGQIISVGKIHGGIDMDGSEPFSLDDFYMYKKDLQSGEWVYLPDITPVDKNIIDVKYDWQQMKVYITIADQFRPGPHEFDCTTTWTDQDCVDAINSKFK